MTKPASKRAFVFYTGAAAWTGGETTFIAGQVPLPLTLFMGTAAFILATGAAMEWDLHRREIAARAQGRAEKASRS